MPKDLPDIKVSKLPGISRQEALRRLRKAGIEYRTIDRPRSYLEPVPPALASSLSHEYDEALGVRSGALNQSPINPVVSRAESFAPIAQHKRSTALRALKHQTGEGDTELAERLLSRYPKAAMRRAIGYGRVSTRVSRGAGRLLRRLKERGGILGLGLTAASLGSSIKEASKK